MEQYNRVQDSCHFTPRKGGGERGWYKQIFEEIMAINIPNLVKDIHLQIQEAVSTPYKLMKTIQIHINTYNWTAKNQRLANLESC